MILMCIQLWILALDALDVLDALLTLNNSCYRMNNNVYI